MMRKPPDRAAAAAGGKATSHRRLSIRLAAVAAVGAALVVIAAVWGMRLLQSAQETSPAPAGSVAEQVAHVRWERAPHDPGAGHDPGLGQWMGGVIAGGPGFISWGLDEHKLPEGVGAAMVIWTSTDAQTWREVTFERESLSHRAIVDDIAAGPHGVVAVGGVCCTLNSTGGGVEAPARWFSLDGEHWSAERLIGIVPGTDLPTALVAGPGGFVQVGAANGRPAAWFSPNGRSWTWISLGVAGFASGIVNDVAVDGHGYVAVGHVASGDQAIAAVWRSTDGAHWTRVGIPDPLLSSGEIVELQQVVSYSGGVFAVGQRTLPPDRQTCEPRKGPTNPPSPAASPEARALLALLICTTSEQVRLISPDGELWKVLAPPSDRQPSLNDFHNVRSGGPGLIAIGTGPQQDSARPRFSLWTSRDGVDWTETVDDPPFAEQEYPSAFVVQEDRIVAVGQSNDGAAVWISDRVP